MTTTNRSSGLGVVTLRRPLLARLFGTTVQWGLTFVAVMFAVTAIAVIKSGDWKFWPYLVIQAILVVLWWRGVFAWAQVDGEGLRWRYWAGYQYPWSTITGITLTRRSPTNPAPGKGAPIIVIRAQDGDEFIAPALSCGRHRREFAATIVAAARAQGKPVEVIYGDWTSS